MDAPTAQEKCEQIFFAQPKVHQNKFVNLNKMVPSNLLRMNAFFEQCQATNKAAGILDKIAKDKKQPKEKKTAHLPVARSHELSYRQHRSWNIATIIKATNAIATITNLTIFIKMIDAMIALDVMTRT